MFFVEMQVQKSYTCGPEEISHTKIQRIQVLRDVRNLNPPIPTTARRRNTGKDRSRSKYNVWPATTVSQPGCLDVRAVKEVPLLCKSPSLQIFLKSEP